MYNSSSGMKPLLIMLTAFRVVSVIFLHSVGWQRMGGALVLSFTVSSEIWIHSGIVDCSMELYDTVALSYGSAVVLPLAMPRG